MVQLKLLYNMAKSKNGGTRAFIRGRIGSDVYSVGKDGMGKRQQVVRSLAEQVSNPRSSAQMFGRMVMSTVMQAVSALQPIIDPSFDGVAKGQPSISEFIRRNYALVKADATAHPAESNVFGLNKYQEKGIQCGPWVISNGKVEKPAAVALGQAELQFNLTNDTLTVAGLRAALGLSADGYITYVCVIDGGTVEFARLRVNPEAADATVISAETLPTIFLQEGNVTLTLTFSGTSITAKVPSSTNALSMGVIVSEKENGAWVHSACTLVSPSDMGIPSDVALPTYPVGTEQFLNGGDL